MVDEKMKTEDEVGEGVEDNLKDGAVITVHLVKVKNTEGQEGVSVSVKFKGSPSIMFENFSVIVSALGRGLLDDLVDEPLIKSFGLVQLCEGAVAAANAGFSLPGEVSSDDEHCDCPACALRRTVEEEEGAR